MKKTAEYKVIHWPREDVETDPQWLVEINPTDGSYFPIGKVDDLVRDHNTAVEMLEALTGLVQAYDSGLMVAKEALVDGIELAKARAAIAHATGGGPNA